MPAHKTTFLFTVLASGLLYFGCATPYQSSNFFGGFSETQLAPDVFRVSFSGNGYTSGERAQDFVMLWAADLTVAHGYAYFAVLNENNSVQQSSYVTPGYAATTINSYGYYAHASTTYYPAREHIFYKPSSGLLVGLFHSQPTNLYTFDAVFLQNSLRQKYKIVEGTNAVAVKAASKR